MQTPLGKRSFSSALAAAVGIAAFGGSLISAEATFAALPAGLSCVSADGKINGRGSTYQTSAQATFWAGFRDDFCGATANTPTDPAADGMGVYNYPSAVTANGGLGLTGSGNGIKAANCRTDAYSGSDNPYNETQLGQLDGAPGNATIGGCTLPADFAQPFAPNSSTSTAYPNASDTAANIMAIPIAGSSVAIGINLTAADCGTPNPPGPLSFTGAQMSFIMGGGAITWNDPALVAGNPSLAGCAVTIKRVIRADSSGTTGILKNYLVRVDDPRVQAGACAPGATWTSFAGSGTNWPSSGTCSPTTASADTGGPALITKLGATDGGVGYADLADEVAGVQSFGLVTASLMNAAGTASVSPASGRAANCDYGVLSLPGSSVTDSVGLNSHNNWGSDNATVNGTGNHVNATDLGVKYPICGITFDLVYSGLSAGDGTTPNPISKLSVNQRRTLYSFVNYILSNAAQNRLASAFYAPLPVAWLAKLVAGFQSAY